MSDKVSTWLWCDGTAEEQAQFYTSLIPDSRIVGRTTAAADNPSNQAGDVMTVEFELGGRSFFALNGGPHFTFTEAISLQIECEDQAEVDRYWEALSSHPDAEQCGWVKDRWGLSWQIVPTVLAELMADPDIEKAARVTKAMLQMKKLDIAALEAAASAR